MVAQAKKGELPLEVWWGVSHDFHWQLHSFISCSGFYHRALPPLHSDEGLFCKEKGTMEKNSEIGGHKALLLSTGPNSKGQGHGGVMTTQTRSWQLLCLPRGNHWECRKAGLPCGFLLPRNNHPKQMVPCAPAADAPQASHATGALHLP